MNRLILLLLILFLSLPFASTADAAPQVTKAEFCTIITDREPGDSPKTITVGQKTIYFFTELLDGSNQTISHRWYYNGIQIADVALKIDGDRWRTWSAKQVWHLTPGSLRVEVVDAAGLVLAEKEIMIQ